MEIRKTSKRKTYSAVEKALLLEKYKTSGAKKTQWCAENVIDLFTEIQPFPRDLAFDLFLQI